MFVSNIKKALGLSTAALALIAAPACAQEQIDADPALWKVADEDTTIYLFGTFHFLEGNEVWFDGAVRDAYDASSEVYIEAVPETDASVIQAAMMEHVMLSGDQTLESLVAPEAYALFVEKAETVGLPAMAVAKMEPTMASFTLTQMSLPGMGLTMDKGADMTILNSANEDGKTLGGLETTVEQLAALGGVSLEAQAKVFNEGMAEFDDLPEMFETMRTNWATGNTAGFEEVFKEMNDGSPESYQAILVDRNAKWTQTLAERMDQPGTVFVAVGTGHLVGGDSVQSMLEAKGFTIERVQ
ncbi:TraB/GumN family protein [Sphingomicrobium sp. XHP0235]|uniref:TraB/GumN family protein n=1 Tax=Sphingomicrobium aquimarinum TaxID=3133971 RepID=UPI0031FE819B